MTRAVPGCVARTGVPHGAAKSVPCCLGWKVLRSRATAGLIGRATNGTEGRYVVAAARARSCGRGRRGRSSAVPRPVPARASGASRAVVIAATRKVAAHARAEVGAGHFSGSSVIPEQEELT